MASPEPLTVRSGRIRRARRLATRSFRVSTGEFLVEGPHAVGEALVHGAAIAEIFATVETGRRHPALLAAARAAGAPWTEVAAEVVDHVADAVNPQGVVARCRDVVVGADRLPPAPRLVLVAADVRDPGNAGALVRCADAAGADAVLLGGDSVDPQSPKAVRASAGSLFHLPVVVERDVAAGLAALRERGLRVLAADGSGSTGLFEAELAGPTAWLVGNEAWGLPEPTRGLADEVVAVPIYGRAESLNLAAAAAVCLYASAYAHRVAPGQR